MNKKFLIGCLCSVFLMSAVFSACQMDKSNNENNDEVYELNLSYMKDLAIDVHDSTAFGIKKVEIANHESSAQASLCGVSLLNSDLAESDKKIREKNYLYKTTTTYENGNVEYGQNSIAQVTFRKNDSVNEEVYDEKGNLIPQNRVVTQDEISAQINKLYVTEKYMFLQFVALIAESGYYDYYENDDIKTEWVDLRPEELTYDENGISDFDLKNYRSSELFQSFIVDMESGYIYKIEGFTVAEIFDTDIILDKNDNYYKISINDNRELVFTDIMPNKEVHIDGLATDKYGYTIVDNSSFDFVDHKNKIYYFTRTSMRCWCVISDSKEAYFVDFSNYSIKNMLISGELTEFSKDRVVSGFHVIGNKEYPTKDMRFMVNGAYYGYRVWGMMAHGNEIIGDILYVEGLNDSNGVLWMNDTFLSSVLIMSNDNKLYYKIINIEDYVNSATLTLLDVSDFEQVSDVAVEYELEYYMAVGRNKMKVKDVYFKQELTGTKYYKLVRTGQRVQLVLLEDKDYTQNVFIFQPINKIS